MRTSDRLRRLNTVILFAILLLLTILFETGPGNAIINTALRPLQPIMSIPVNSETPAVEESLIAENTRLKEQLDSLQQERAVNDGATHLPAAVVTYSTSPYRNALVIDVGSGDGVAIGDTVTSQGFLVGLVIETNDNNSTVALLNDETFHGIGETEQQTQGILTGRYNAVLFERIPRDSPLSEGDIVYSSKLDSTLLADVPVGRVQAVYEDGALLKYAQIASPVDFTNIDAVSVVK